VVGTDPAQPVGLLDAFAGVNEAEVALLDVFAGLVE